MWAEVAAAGYAQTQMGDELFALRDAWDAAPADPVALIPRGRCHQTCLDLLAALGFPAASRDETRTP